MWSWNGEDAGFIELNNKVEKLLNRRLKQIVVSPLKSADDPLVVATEIHDELGGLFLTQPFLGPARDTKTKISEEFNWFDLPENIDLLFNLQRNTDQLSENRK